MAAMRNSRLTCSFDSQSSLALLGTCHFGDGRGSARFTPSSVLGTPYSIAIARDVLRKQPTRPLIDAIEIALPYSG